MVSRFYCKKMLRVLPVVSQEVCDLPTELENSRKTSGEQRQHCESAALVLCYKGEGLGEKELVCLASVNEKNNWFWVFNRQTVWKISLINYLQSGHIHTHTEATIIYLYIQKYCYQIFVSNHLSQEHVFAIWYLFCIIITSDRYPPYPREGAEKYCSYTVHQTPKIWLAKFRVI